MVEFGCLSNTNDYPTYATGVGGSITMTKIALCGLKVRVLFGVRTNNLDLLCVLHKQPFQKKKKKKVVHVSGFFEDRESHYSATRDVPEVNSKYPTTTSPPSMTVPPSSDEHTDMETSVLVEDTINTP